ncbi:hypothetical protein [Collimonas fungivorans]|uniref:hypothetical protein n=1 Tax=Collimonas fungivorans TaxID=158899 RepID=UPI003FA34D45
MGNRQNIHERPDIAIGAILPAPQDGFILKCFNMSTLPFIDELPNKHPTAQGAPA